MKEVDIFSSKVPIELSVKKQQAQASHKLIDKIHPHNNHIIWQINIKTLQIEKAKFATVNYVFGGENKKEIIKREGFNYVAALNKKNALKKHKQGKTGSKEIILNPLKLIK